MYHRFSSQQPFMLKIKRTSITDAMTRNIISSCFKNIPFFCYFLSYLLIYFAKSTVEVFSRLRQFYLEHLRMIQNNC